MSKPIFGQFMGIIDAQQKLAAAPIETPLSEIIWLTAMAWQGNPVHGEAMQSWALLVRELERKAAGR